MSGNQVVIFILAIIYLFGFYNAWRKITYGYGLIWGHIPGETLIWLNKKKAGSIVVKILISVLFAYVYAAAAILKGILALFTLILRR